MSVKVSTKRGWQTKITEGMKAALLEMVLDVDRRAGMLAPYDTGALVRDRKVENTGTPADPEYTLTYGSDKVPYARLRHFVNKKNPQTIGYLSKAADAVDRGDKTKYFKGKV